MEKAATDTNTYTLTHWRILCFLGDLMLEGDLHERPDIPNATPISTSRIKDWRFENDYVYFYTENSIYRCALSDYIFDGSLNFILYPDQYDTEW